MVRATSKTGVDTGTAGYNNGCVPRRSRRALGSMPELGSSSSSSGRPPSMEMARESLRRLPKLQCAAWRCATGPRPSSAVARTTVPAAVPDWLEPVRWSAQYSSRCSLAVSTLQSPSNCGQYPISRLAAYNCNRKSRIEIASRCTCNRA